MIKEELDKLKISLPTKNDNKKELCHDKKEKQ